MLSLAYNLHVCQSAFIQTKFGMYIPDMHAWTYETIMDNYSALNDKFDVINVACTCMLGRVYIE